jgi:hypothetical protein
MLTTTRILSIVAGLVLLFLLIIIARSCQQDYVDREDLDPPRDPLPGAEDATSAVKLPPNAEPFALPA